MNAKLDGRLAAPYTLTLLTPGEARIAATERVTVLIRITGELAAVEQAGLRTSSSAGTSPSARSLLAISRAWPRSTTCCRSTPSA